MNSGPEVGPVEIVNDGFGALAVALNHLAPTVVADTVMSQTAIAANVERNRLQPVTIEAEVDRLPPQPGLVLIKVPKSLGQLEDQLHRLRPKLTPSTVLIGAGMTRHIHTSTLERFETIVGPTTSSRAERKARLIHATFDPDLAVGPNPWPTTWRHAGLTVVNRGGVFSAASIDIGTRFLLDHLPGVGSGARVVDLGCGNGIVAAAVAARSPNLDLVLADASYAAIRSAESTWRASHGARRAEFHHVDRLVEAVAKGSVDVVINNPPFHDERAVGDATAWDMFVDSHAVLRPGGELRVVANRHLGHHTRLQKIFGNCTTEASNRKFVVLSAVR